MDALGLGVDFRRAAGRALAVAVLRLVLAIPLYLSVLYAAGGMTLLLSADLRTWETLGFSGFLGSSSRTSACSRRSW